MKPSELDEEIAVFRRNPKRYLFAIVVAVTTIWGRLDSIEVP